MYSLGVTSSAKTTIVILVGYVHVIIVVTAESPAQLKK